MENVLIALFCIALMLFAGLTIAHSNLWSTDTVAVAWKQMESITGEIARTHISTLSARTTDGVTVDLTLANAGETRLRDFEKWDVILQYYDEGQNYWIKRLTYESGTPANNEWTVEGIYLDAVGGAPEVFEPGIFNPDEEMKIRMVVSPAVGTPNANLVTVATANGVGASEIFTRE